MRTRYTLKLWGNRRRLELLEYIAENPKQIRADWTREAIRRGWETNTAATAEAIREMKQAKWINENAERQLEVTDKGYCAMKIWKLIKTQGLDKNE